MACGALCRVLRMAAGSGQFTRDNASTTARLADLHYGPALFPFPPPACQNNVCQTCCPPPANNCTLYTSLTLPRRPEPVHWLPLPYDRRSTATQTDAIVIVSCRLGFLSITSAPTPYRLRPPRRRDRAAGTACRRLSRFSSGTQAA